MSPARHRTPATAGTSPPSSGSSTAPPPLAGGSGTPAPAPPLAAGAAVLPGPPGDAAGLGAGALGAPLATYPGVLLTNTAAPVWRGPRRSIPPLFAASAVSGAASLL